MLSLVPRTASDNGLKVRHVILVLLVGGLVFVLAN